MVGPGVDARPGIVGILALEQLRHAAGIFDVLDAALEFAHGIVEHLAVLFTDQGADLLSIPFQQCLEAIHDLSALGGRHGAPGGQGIPGGLYRALHDGGIGQWQTAHGLRGSRIEHIQGAFASHGVTANQVSQGIHRSVFSLVFSRREWGRESRCLVLS